MKKTITIVFFILSLQSGFARIHVLVSKISIIQKEIEKALPGDTLLFKAGVYFQSGIQLNKRLFLLGEKGAIIDGQQKFEILTISADGAIVDGLHFRNGGYSSYNDIAAVRILNAKNVVIRNNILERTFFGIYSQHGRNCVIQNNKIFSDAQTEQNSANGIHCWKSDSMLIENNSISGHRDGIYFEFVTNSIIRNNHSFRNVRYGLHFMFSNSDSYLKNIFEQNGAGVAVMFSHHVNMFHNRFERNWGAASYGLLLKEISDGEIRGNYFGKNSSGIYMEGTNRMNVSGNDFVSNGWALKVQASCDDNHFEENNFISNSFDVATNGSLVLNHFLHNYWDKYEGYDMNRDGVGDVPYRPLSIYAMVVERNPTSLMLFRSFMVALMDRSEKILPGITPENLKDPEPFTRPLKH